MAERSRTIDSLAAQFSTELKTMLEGSFSTFAIARWAFRFYMEKSVCIPREMENDIMRIVAMQGVPELEISRAELASIADRYRTDQ